jgi:hypothetical protein
LGKQRPEEQQRAIGVLVGRTDRLRNEIERVARDLIHRTRTSQDKAVAALNAQIECRTAHIVDRESLVEKPQETTAGPADIDCVAGTQARPASVPDNPSDGSVSVTLSTSRDVMSVSTYVCLPRVPCCQFARRFAQLQL